METVPSRLTTGGLQMLGPEATFQLHGSGKGLIEKWLYNIRFVCAVWTSMIISRAITVFSSISYEKQKIELLMSFILHTSSVVTRVIFGEG